MLKVLEDNKTIYLTQGDTLDVTVTPLVEGDDGSTYEYDPYPGDTVRFAVASAYGQEPLIVQSIPTDTMRLRVEAATTKLLNSRKKPYVYDVQLTQEDGTVITFIDKGELYITDEVE